MPKIKKDVLKNERISEIRPRERDEEKTLDPDLILGDEVLVADTLEEEESEDEDEMALDDEYVNPYGDKFEE